MAELIKETGKAEYKTILGDLDGKKADATLLVGGKDENTSGKFVPNINASKWDDEVFININLPVEIAAERETFSDGTIALTAKGIEHKFYVDENGKLNWAFNITSPLASNVLEFDMTYSSALKFHYQDSLYNDYHFNEKNAKNDWATYEDFLKDHYRPNNVIGSYAVYFKKGFRYKTGKFCHIHTPKVTDSLGSELWLPLEIDEKNKKLRIVIDPVWLASAQYPLKINDTLLFGYNTDGGTTWGPGATKLMACKQTVAVSGTATTFHSYQYFDVGEETTGGYYDDSGGAPNTVQRDTAGFDGQAGGANWNQAALDSTQEVTSGQTYWLTTQHDSTGNLYYDTGDTGQSLYDGAVTYVSGTLEASISGSGYDREYSYYVDGPEAPTGALPQVITIILSKLFNSFKLAFLPPMLFLTGCCKNNKLSRRELLTTKNWLKGKK